MDEIVELKTWYVTLLIKKWHNASNKHNKSDGIRLLNK